MHHIDEHTLELYALKAEEVADRADEIEEHLHECHGCRTLVEEMRGYYSELDEELKREPLPEVSSEHAIVKRQLNLQQQYNPYAPPAHYMPNTPLAKMFYFIRRHPVVTVTSSFAAFAMVGWLLNDFIKPDKKENVIADKNPASYYLNVSTGYLEIRNKEAQKVWEIPSNGIANFKKREFDEDSYFTAISDLNNDGKSEVLTTVSPVGYELNNHFLRIYSSYGKPLEEISFGKDVNYRGRKYSNLFTTGQLLVKDMGNGSKNIFVLVRNQFSPSYLARLDAQGNIIGEYWHFGFPEAIYWLDVDENDKMELLLCGENDVSDTNHREFPMIAVLDPEKIIGVTESQCTPGFGLKKSDAEIFYLRLPRTDIDDALNLTPAIMNLMNAGNGELKFTTMSRMGVSDYINLFYSFTKDLHTIQIKSNNLIDQKHYELVKQGRLTGIIDSAYLDKLKNSIRYWDGKGWRKEWTMVKLQP